MDHDHEVLLASEHVVTPGPSASEVPRTSEKEAAADDGILEEVDAYQPL